MNIAHEVNYVALDSLRMIIPWVSAKSADGKVTVYRNTELNISDSQIERHEKRRMDCIDCHNRPSHIYHPPARSVNHLMTLGWIDPSLPNAKSIAVHALEGPYSSSSAATDSIKTIIEEFYSANFPAVASAKQAEIARMIEEVQKIYSRNYFPEMRVNWGG